jgi:hypothetical protein
MLNRVDDTLIRRHARLILAGGVALVALLAALGPIALETAIGYRESNHQALRLAETLSIGDSKQHGRAAQKVIHSPLGK